MNLLDHIKTILEQNESELSGRSSSQIRPSTTQAITRR